MNPEAWRALRHHPAVVPAITQRANAICDEANTNAVTSMDPRAVTRLSPSGDPAYLVTVQDNPSTSRARARIKPNPDNMLGVVAEAAESALLKATLANPSDPIPGAEA